MNNKKNEISLRRSQLSPAKQALLEKRLRGELKLDKPEKFIPRRSQHNPVPLSFSQQRLWFLAQLEPDNPFYNISAVVRLQGKLNYQALQDSLQEIINRHEVLRCNFQTIEDKPVAFIHSSKTLFITLIDISELAINQQSAEIQKLASQEANQPFDLNDDLLLRAKLIQLNPTEHILLFTMHHIVSDGWSIGVLIHELLALYPAFCEDKTSSLAELPIQYGDFAIWQKEYLQGEALTSQKNYWKQQLGGSLPVLQLPQDYPRPAVQSYKGKTHTFTIPKSLTTAIKALSQQAGATLFMTLLTAFKILLYRYSQQEDIIIGTAIANRNLPQIEKLIGFFVNTLVLRTDVSGNPSFLDLLARVKQTTLDAYTHQDLPFEQLVEEIQPERNLSHNPLFQVWFSLNNSPMPALEIGELTLTISGTESATAQFDLSLDMVEQQEEIIGKFEYSSDLFNADTINRITEHFQTLLAGIIATPQQKIASLPLLTASEQQQLLQQWNNTEVAYPVDKCIHELFEKQVIKTPEKIAVVFADSQLTYQELNIKANQLARFLQNLGVQQGEFIAIVKQRDINFLIAILAIFKAGGVYVPIDSTYPESRIRYMVSNSEVRFLLTDSSWQDTHLFIDCPQLKHLIFLDSKADQKLLAQTKSIKIYNQLNFAHLATENLTTNHTGVAPAYMIYTSGSTGSPKGAIIRHGGAINHIYAQFDALKLTESLTFIQSAPASSDISVWQFLAPILIGGKTIIVDTDTVCSPSELFQVIQKHNITIVELVPVVLTALLDYVANLSPEQRLLPNLQWMMVTGESASVPLVNRWLQLYPDIKVVNAYGPTEAADDITQMIIDQPLPENSLTVPIGKPLANLNLYILDSQMQLVPIGVPGEICVSGFGVGLGYWKNEHKTNLSFIPNPFISTAKPLPGTNTDFIYKTGDLGRWLSDGNIEFLGRIDNQVKIRGFRIELGEIEAVIKQHPNVGEAVVIAREDIPGDRRLVAYFVQHSQEQLAIDLREFLEQKLPEYMIPAAFVALEALPITPNGKLDRRALPAPKITQLSSPSDFIAPSTAIEKQLVNIWTEILGIDNIGIHHNFFNLGGHSLLATRLISQIRQTFQIELPLRRIFEKPTIAGLAKDIEKATKTNSQVEEIKITRIARSPHLPLSFAQQRFWFLAQLEMHSSAYNMPSAVRLQGNLNIKALQQTFQEILRRHEALRTNFQTIEGQPVAVILPPDVVQLPILDISNLPANQQELEVKKQTTEEAQIPFDLNNGCLLRVKLLRLSEQEHILLLTMHHIASDAWSTDILLREFVTLYQAFCQAQPAPLAELPIQYVDFADWQRQWLQGERLESQISYWRQQLKGVPELLELPTDFPRPPIQSFQGATYSFKLPQQLSVGLNQLSQQQGTTLFMTLLAAFQTLLYRYTGSEDLAIGSPIANRDRIELEGLIGLFINTLVLRTNLAGNPSFIELLKRVREVALGAYAHQDLPFELLVEELQPQRNLSHTPLFQVMFVLQNASMSALELPGLTLNYLPVDSGTAKFDLTLDMTETIEGLVANFEYNSDLFQASTIKRMAGHFQTLLEGIIANPQQRLSQLPLLTASEKHQLLQPSHNTEITYPVDEFIHELFAQQVEKTPDAVAVVYENQQLTYQELNAKANQLAHYLRSLGVKPEVLVGICIERSLEMVIGLLAILKAGGAYIPLDPNYPQQRLEYILEDTQASVLLTQASLLELLPQHQGQIVCLDSDWHLIAQQSQNSLSSELTTENLAYIIYTSGSTGKPKGVQIPHMALSNFLYSMKQAPGLTSQDKLLAVTTYSFDIAALEIFLPLIVGACLIVASQEIIADGIQLLAKIKASKATVMQATPATWQLLLAAGWDENLQLKILCGGEALSAPLASQLLQRCSSLWNMYGPTETTIWSAASQIKTVNKTVTISSPIANTQLYILDQYNQLVPDGVPGELCIGGAGLARGYFNRPDLTVEKFIPHPFSDRASARLYKTGDLARYLPNREIEYLGRIDNQVKIRGFRIELGEIEAVISQYSGVRETVVTVREDSASQRLVAYIVPTKELTPNISELRNFLETKLPNYMIPAAFVTLEALPLTPNGKVDRKALPAPDIAKLGVNQELVKPRNFVETKLTEIFTEVLGVDRVGIFDNFFELGGDSIVAIVVITKANQAGIKLTVKQLFQHQTVANLASVAVTQNVIQAEQKVTNKDTSAHFSKANLNQTELDRFLAKVKRTSKNQKI
ncbi:MULTISPECIES: non-ribosomal peptide synthetase [Calothrix]|uniref:Amino acid adenylation domain-containing protein n=2 Tax=Calothrix TaxID=1186 RepID=A0ABR8AKG7_9CYAN|nr:MULTISPECIES: non-ribosomal peptide synthetase [Calothrix]MBD2199778.1 amino acid adenylation domain-containing protein [Calothrix parietina FACHB-288]MBD2228574.1 amino acid adenylation domain-containing protein [Calothrix anomala FACHB-343]